MRNQELLNAVTAFGLEVTGVIVFYKGRPMLLTGHPGDWQASTQVQPENVEEHEVSGFGANPLDACKSCMEEADFAENEDVDSDDEEEEDE